MTNAPTSRTSTAERVSVGAVVALSCEATREAGAYRPLAASGTAVSVAILATLALLGLLALLGGLMQPSSAAPNARRKGGLQGIPVH